MALASIVSGMLSYIYRYKTGQIALLDVKRGGVIVSRLRGHDEEVYSLSWCPIPGEDYRQSQTSDDITDLESFGIGKWIIK